MEGYVDKKRYGYSTTQYRARAGLSGRTCLNSLIGTDLQEQGSSRPGTCCNKGITKTATAGGPYLAHVHSTGH